MYIEIVEKSLSNRGTIILSEQLISKPRAFSAYISHFPYGNEIVDYVKVHGSVSKYSGKQYCPKIIVDFDNEDLSHAHESVNSYIKRLVSEYRCPIEQIEISFSGKKGFHVSFHSEALGGVEPAVGINNNVKLLVQKLTTDISDADYRIYDNTRVIRLINSVNEKSGLYKIPLTYDEFSAGINSITDLAKKPRNRMPSKKILVPKLRELWLSCREPLFFENDSAHGKHFFSPPEKGNRNNKLFAQACRLFECSNFSTENVKDIISNSNQASKFPLSESELESVINSAKSRMKPFDDVIVAKTLDELAPEWLEYNKPEAKQLTLLDADFDKAVKGKLKGKLIPVIGYPGTMKSLLVLNIAAENLSCNNSRVLYSNMEMGAPELINRAIDVSWQDDSGNLISQELEKFVKTDSDRALKLYYKLVEKLGNRLYICQNSINDVSQYENLLSEIERKSGKVEFLIIDGLSMMGGKGTATELVNKHTAELKALANKIGVTVFLIVHLSKGLEYHTRDVLKNARDSQKIVDNGDYFIMLSLCVDNSIGGDEISYLQDMVYCRLWAKRGSGKRVSKIFELTRGTLKMVSTSYDPTVYDPKKKNRDNDF